MLRSSIAVFMFSLIALGSAHAEEGFYAGGMIIRTKVDVDGIGTVRPTVIGVRVGGALNRHVAFEARLGTGLQMDKVRFGGGEVNVSFDSLTGGYAKGLWPITDDLGVYGLAGYTQATQRLTGPGGSSTITDVHLSYGAGIDIKLFGVASVEVEYARLYKGSDYRVDGLTLGAAMKF